jgi:hypothetical protein
MCDATGSSVAGIALHALQMPMFSCSVTASFWGTTDFQSVDYAQHRRTGSPAYRSTTDTDKLKSIVPFNSNLFP